MASVRVYKDIQQEKKFPIVLSHEDVIYIFESVNNIKHKAILMLAYSAGLRVQDIDTKRNLIHIKAAKGNDNKKV